jgi:phospholipid/cholesterol/gamma-HCH transport system ATP-binding protein
VRRNPIVEVEELTIGYGQQPILEKVSFTVERGEIFFILGGSGSGKTTLLRHMIGLHRPAAGRVLIQGRDLIAAAGKERHHILRGMGVMFQGGALFGSLNLLENVLLPLEELTDLPHRAVEIMALMKLQLVGLQDVTDKMPAELSGGMRKRAAIARAMALDPELLLLDEPTTGLDPITAGEIDQLVARLARHLGVTVIIVTHDLDSVAAIADRLILLDGEQRGIIAMGNPSAVRQNPAPLVQRFFSRQATAVSLE